MSDSLTASGEEKQKKHTLAHTCINICSERETLTSKSASFSCEHQGMIPTKTQQVTK